MTTSSITRRRFARLGGGLSALALALGFGLSGAQAQDVQTPHKGHQGHAMHTAAAPPLTVHRRLPSLVTSEPIVATDGFYDGTGFFRRWNDTRLYSFYGWRLGGDNFYGDQAGDPITRGNASLGMIAGYGPANGGYGGPHFDIVGGFHNGPGPGAQEADDYATGSIWQPHYDRPQPHYPSIRQQVAELNTGLAGTGQVARVKSSRERWEEAYRASAVQRASFGGSVPVADQPHEDAGEFGGF